MSERRPRDFQQRPNDASRARYAFPLLVIAAVAAVLFWFGKSPEEGPFEGNRAPAFALMDLAGELVESTAFAGQPLFINFWATWCEPCRYEMPEIQALYDEAGGAFEVIAVSDEPLPTVQRYLDQFGYTFPVMLDVDRSMYEDYAVFALPTSVFIDARGVIRAVHLGQLTREQMETYLARIVPEMGRR